MTNNKGFTLIELILVILISGIVIGIISNLGFLIINERKLTLKAYEIMQCLIEIRDNAFTKDEGYPDWVYFYPFSDLILIKSFDKAKNTYKTIKIIDLSIEGIDLLSAVFGNNNYVYFNRLSVPSSGGTIAICYKNVRKYIVITPATGRIYISNEAPRNWE
ncbi:prepilin-type N-terminal cleavage/methylation domain-containing protein [Dictyoglomus thermophilum]|uniref:Prepilin-type N-terminal cleavage/methylation domain protein n=1 Tax=Dictyoglomus thermophilum (strain ATCC 35947 / DSM 3960 / H-6-12) TaxID=309799 RepID=B5YDY9_DICT6|nr:prepilin-type N-terminal cleavage/methylation domain-containing protein [Dictyoglomus thermophilum]ACI18681.1 prepilin-type N-terminal cleavage/methylation domain protein [Dictyoglomus thermophilum H-6-12]